MLEFLRTYYGITGQESSPIRGISTYVADNMHYLLFRVTEREEFMMEQAVIAYYLKEQEQPHIAYPLQNIDGQFVTPIDDERYIVSCVHHLQQHPHPNDGTVLAQFHKHSKAYPYEPFSISSYGKWNQLWIDKLTVYEQNLQVTLKEERAFKDRAWFDVFPYVIGITENAIQYVGEMNREQSFNDSDRPAITFERYKGQLQEPCFFSHELHYDHPMRDVAEWIRTKLLEKEDHTSRIRQFLRDYEYVQPLSLFSWKMIYARLLYPAHLFDAIDRHQTKEQAVIEEEIAWLCHHQHVYETRLKALFQQIERNDQTIRIPMVQWI